MHIYIYMLLCMRTTIDIPDELAIAAKKAAVERRTTLRELVVRGLRTILSDPTTASVTSPVDALEGLGREVWRGVDPDDYVKELRQGWE
jgi:hypothetical protein